MQGEFFNFELGDEPGFFIKGICNQNQMHCQLEVSNQNILIISSRIFNDVGLVLFFKVMICILRDVY